jgi:hypothetical protein
LLQLEHPTSKKKVTKNKNSKSQDTSTNDNKPSAHDGFDALFSITNSHLQHIKHIKQT